MKWNWREVTENITSTNELQDKKMVREIKAAVVLNVSITYQISYEKKFETKNFKATLMQIWKSADNFIFAQNQCTEGITL